MDLVDASIPQGGEIYEPVRRVEAFIPLLNLFVEVEAMPSPVQPMTHFGSRRSTTILVA